MGGRIGIIGGTDRAGVAPGDPAGVVAVGVAASRAVPEAAADPAAVPPAP